jgi:prolyl oligopeptidase
MKLSRPFKEGNYTYFYKMDCKINIFVYRRERRRGKNQCIYRSKYIFKDGTVSMAGLDFFKDASRALFDFRRWK